jgi:hypothetical protein
MIRRLIGVWRIEVPMSDRAARRLDKCIFMRGPGQLPSAVAEDDFAAQPFQRVDSLRRLFPRGKDQNFRLGHAASGTT